MKISEKKQIIKMSAIVLGLFAVILSVTYAFINVQLTGSKKQVITAGTLDLELDEDENNLTIENALPMYDEVGMIQDAFTFRLINNVEMPTNYILKLVDVTTGDKLPTSIVKYGLTKNGVGEPKLLSNIPDDGTIDSGVIGNKETIEYALRLWIDEGVTNNSQISGKSLKFKLNLEANQIMSDSQESIDLVAWNYKDSYSDSLSLETLYGSNAYSGLYLIKVSDVILNKDKLVGLSALIDLNKDLTNCGDSCVTELNITEDVVNNSINVDASTGALSFNNVMYLIENGFSNNGITVTPGVWLVALGDGTTLTSMINEIVLYEPIEEKKVAFTFAGVNKEATTITKKSFFNNTNEGCSYYDYSNKKNICGETLTNGIYMMDDDDGVSYFFRGEVDNLVKFGEYKEDYYVYRYEYEDQAHDLVSYEFTSLEACKIYDKNCSESNKVLKHPAKTPMYWKIVRINGDGTIRMVYAGTTPDAPSSDVFIGGSIYAENHNNIKSIGYSYDRNFGEVSSRAKIEIDNWYSNNFQNTVFDSMIATGKFCSDTSSYLEDIIPLPEMPGTALSTFGPGNRFGMFISNVIKPTFTCPATQESYGGSYELKAGLLTADEVIAAGANPQAYNDNFYLHSDEQYWTMSPFAAIIDAESLDFGFGLYSTVVDGHVASSDALGVTDDVYMHPAYPKLRPVINLNKNVVFKAGTNGSVTTPYEVVAQ